MTLMSIAFLFSTFAFAAPVLQTGDYGVTVYDRYGRAHNCTLEIQSYSDHLVLSINNCPPPVNNVRLNSFDNGEIFVSDKIYVSTRRGGYKFYEILPLSESSFKMISYREYGDGGVGKPREVIATLK
jgi:hypothetical protein